MLITKPAGGVESFAAERGCPNRGGGCRARVLRNANGGQRSSRTVGMNELGGLRGRDHGYLCSGFVSQGETSYVQAKFR